LPQLTLSGSEELGVLGSQDRDFGTLDLNLWSEFVRFDRDSNAPVAVTGNRFTVYPSVSLPMSQSFAYVTPKIGVHYTKYSLENVVGPFDRDSRAVPIFSVDSGMYFDRDMRVVKNVYTHTIEPRLFYVYAPHYAQNHLPNFDTALSDLNLATIFSENQFSGGDRINDANQVTLAVTSRLIDQKTGTQRLSVTLGERFYFSDQRVVLPGGTPRTSERSDILAALSAQLSNGWNADAAWQFDTDQGKSVKTNLAARYQPEPGKTLNLGYRYTVDSLEQLDFSAQWPFGNRWYGLGRLNYSLRDNAATGDVRGPIEYLAGVEYDAGCWQGRAILQRLATSTAAATAASAYAFFFQLELGGLSKIGSNPLEIIKRNIPGYVTTGEIPNATR
jgi:LPS-assembly protein